MALYLNLQENLESEPLERASTELGVVTPCLLPNGGR